MSLLAAGVAVPLIAAALGAGGEAGRPSGAVTGRTVVVPLALPARSTAPLPAPTAVRVAAAGATTGPAPLLALTERPLAAPPAEDEPAADAPALERIPVRVRRGESLYLIFKRLRLPQADLAAILSSDRSARRLARLQPGDELDIDVDPSGRVQRLTYHLNDTRSLQIARSGDGFTAEKVEREPAPAAPAPLALAPASAEDIPGSALALGPPPVDPGSVESELAKVAVEVTRGDSLYSIFLERGLSTTELAALLASGRDARALKRLHPGQQIEFLLDDSKSVRKLVLVRDETTSLHVTRDGDRYESTLVEVPLERREAAASGTIDSSLFLAAQRAGLSDATIMELVEIFGWDVDFALDIRSGDHFSVVYEELFKDGEKVRNGHILAAEFVNQGRVIRALRYVDPEGHAEYFSPQGMSMRKAFLRTPVNFTRISSRFTRGRLHPILHRIRAHKGVDYAAPRGTPIRAAGDGKIKYVGRKGGYGKMVILQHGSTYTTVYAHMRGYAKGVRTGKSVRQGQIIGYVGSTGMATGPHLHYEFRVRGVHRDPLRVKLPEAAPIAARFREDFEATTAPRIAQLDLLSRTQMAVTEQQ